VQPRAACSGPLLFTAALLIASTVLMLPIGGQAWYTLPLGRFLAFPWRLMGPALLWASLLGGAALFLLPRPYQTAALVLLLVLIPASVGPYLFPRPFSPAVEPTVAEVAAYELDGGARGTVSADEYRPIWSVHGPEPASFVSALLAEKEPDRLLRAGLPAGTRVEALRLTPLEDAYRLTLPVAANVQIGRFYFPGWRAWIDGRPATISPATDYGVIEIPVPAGDHELRLRFGTTPPRAVGSWLAVIGLAGVFWGITIEARRRLKDGATVGEAQPDRSARAALLIACAVILAVSALKVLVIEPDTGWFRVASSVSAPLNMQFPVHARFTNGLELIGYDLSDPAIRQGSDLTVQLYWRAHQPQTSESHPFVHVAAPTGDAVWANETRAHPGDKPTPHWSTDFYVVDTYRLPIGLDTPAVLGALRVGLLDDAGERIPLTDGRDVSTLGAVRITELRPLSLAALPGAGAAFHLGTSIDLVGHSVEIEDGPPALAVTLFWRAAEPVEEDYSVFLHVLDSTGEVLAQGDGPPVNGEYPTSAWAPGQIIEDRRRIPIPEGTDPRAVQIAVGLYSLDSGERLPATNSRGVRQPDDRILLLPDRGPEGVSNVAE
jgi:hypothetical protein